MIYVEMVGRMGNQMFSYAFARALQEKYPRHKKDKIIFDYTNFAFSLTERNGLKNFVCNERIDEGVRHCSLIQRMVLHLYYRKRNSIIIKNENDIYELEKKWQDYLSIFGIFICSFNYHRFRFLPITKNLLLIGYFESPLFFKRIDSVLREEFIPVKTNYSVEIKAIIRSIESTNSVCLGIRRGDFESNGNKAFCSVCDVQYYRQAIEKIKEFVQNPTFFVFTDDVEWAVQNVELPIGTTIVGDDIVSYDDKLYIMSKCKHFAISNSTYFWWAQHLSCYPNKVVVVPSKWRNITPETHVGIYEEHFITIDVDNR